MIDILVIAFGDTDRNHLLNYNFDKKFKVKTWLFDFWSKRERKSLRKLLSLKKMDGMILGGNQRIEMPTKMSMEKGYTSNKLRNYKDVEENKGYIWDELFQIISYCSNMPILGICMGSHLLDIYYGSEVPTDLGKKYTRKREETRLNDSVLFKDMGKLGYFEYNHIQIIKRHSYNAKVIAWNKTRESGYKFNSKHFGLNFHIIHSYPDAKKIIKNFINLCEMSKHQQTGFYKSGQYLTLILLLIALYSRTFHI
jgi:gamma-glutamyl-gamma-aminobutyrate hydrolase PuuD